MALHPLVEAHYEDAKEFLAGMTREEAFDLDCLKKWDEEFTFVRSVEAGAYAGGNWR